MKRTVTFGTVLAIVLCGRTLVAYDDELHIDITPLLPTTSTPVSIEAWTWFPDPGQQFASASFVRVGFQIDMDVVMQDDYSVSPVVVQDGCSVDCGILPAGLYNVTANMWMIPYQCAMPELFRSGSTSFTVTPEPSTLALLAMGSVGLFVLAGRPRDIGKRG